MSPDGGISGEFLVIVATGSESHLADAFADIVRFALPDAKPRIVIADSGSIPDLANLPEFHGAALVLVAMSNLQGDARPEKKGPFLDWGTWMEKRVRLMRERTNAHLICMSGIDRLDGFKGMERGGAHTVFQIPVRASELEPVILAAYERWLAARQRQFRVLIALSYTGEFPDMLSAVVRDTLPGIPIEVTVAPSLDARDVAAMEETRAADLVIVFISNLNNRLPDDHADEEDELRFARRVRVLRDATPAFLFCGAGIWSNKTEHAMLGAGADIAVPLPFELNRLREAIESAHRRWLRPRGAGDRIEVFRVLIGAGPETILCDIFGMIVRELLPQVSLDIRFTDSRDVREIALLPEARRADMLLFHLSNLRDRIPDDDQNTASPSWHGRRVRALRNTCKGSMFCITGRYDAGTFEAMRLAGADAAHPSPCNMEDLRNFIAESHRRWLAKQSC